SAETTRTPSPGLQSAPQCLIIKRATRATRWMHASWPSCCARTAATGLPRRKWTQDAARVGAQLSDHQQRSNASHESAQGTVSRLGHSLCRYPGLCSALSGGMVEQDPASRGAPSSGAALSTAGWIAGSATKGANRVFGGEPET